MNFLLNLAVMSGVQLTVHAQGSFLNLDFESATVIPIPGDMYGRVEFAPAFPGWVGYIGTNIETLALYNNVFLDSTGLGLQGVGSGRNISENYSASIQSGYTLSGPPDQVIASLGQSGLVPAGSHSIQFQALAFGPFQITLDGQILSLIPLFTTSSYTLYGADVTMFADRTAELRFTALPKPTSPIISTLFLDSIVFSPDAVPEPSALGLFALGALLLGWRFRHKCCGLHRLGKIWRFHTRLRHQRLDSLLRTKWVVFD